jgi:protoheme IX farnesyltransferase
LLIKENYAAARIPMLPVVRGVGVTTRQILAYSLVLVAITVGPFAAGTFGIGYLIAALVLGGPFLWLAAALWRSRSRRRASLLFHYSLLYLALLFVAMALNPLLS